MPPGDKIPKERICGSDLTSSDLRVDVIGEMLNVDLCEHRSLETEGTQNGQLEGRGQWPLRMPRTLTCPRPGPEAGDDQLLTLSLETRLCSGRTAVLQVAAVCICSTGCTEG